MDKIKKIIEKFINAMNIGKNINVLFLPITSVTESQITIEKIMYKIKGSTKIII